MSIKELKFWCQKVLPLVYDDSLSYYELLCKVVDKLNEVIKAIDVGGGNLESVVESILNEWLEDGTLENIIGVTLDNISGGLTHVDRQIPINSGKNIVFIGDSWTVGSGATNPATERFSTLVAQNFDMIEKNFGVGAAGFTRPNTFMSQIENANTTMLASEKNNTSIVLIVGGVNDVRWKSESSLAEFTANVVACVERAKTVFPLAQIVLAVGTTKNNEYFDTDRHWFYSAMEAVKRIHSSGRVLIIDHVGACINGRSNMYASDDLHPNTLGHSTLAGFLCNAIQGGGTDTEYYVGQYSWDSEKVSNITTPHIFRQTENILFGQGIIELQEDISSNTLIGSYTGPYGYSNIYIPVYRGNQNVGAIAITESGNVRLIPNDGVELLTGWQIRIPDHIELFRTLIS